MFRLVIGKYVLRAAAGKDNRLYFRGQDAAVLLGYRSKHFFVKHHCERTLKEITKRGVIFSQKLLDEHYIEYLDMLKKKRIVDDIYLEWAWAIFKDLFISTKVSVTQLQSEPVVKVAVNGEYYFKDWVYYNYFSPIFSLTTPQPPQLQPHSPLTAPPNSPASLTTPPPPQLEPHSPSTASPASSQQPIDYSTRDSTPQQAAAAKIPAPPTTATGSCYILMDACPPNTVKMCFGGQVYEYVRK